MQGWGWHQVQCSGCSCWAGRRTPAGDQGRLQRRTGPGSKPSQVPLPRHAGAFSPQALQLGFSAPLSTCQHWWSAWNSFDTTPCTESLQHRCSSVIPQLSYFYITQHSCLLEQFQAWWEQPPPPGPTCACPATTSLNFTHFTNPELVVPFPVTLQNGGLRNDSLPSSHQAPSLGLFLLPYQDLGKKQNHAWAQLTP